MAMNLRSLVSTSMLLAAGSGYVSGCKQQVIPVAVPQPLSRIQYPTVSESFEGKLAYISDYFQHDQPINKILISYCDRKVWMYVKNIDGDMDRDFEIWVGEKDKSGFPWDSVPAVVVLDRSSVGGLGSIDLVSYSVVNGSYVPESVTDEVLTSSQKAGADWLYKDIVSILADSIFNHDLSLYARSHDTTYNHVDAKPSCESIDDAVRKMQKAD